MSLLITSNTALPSQGGIKVGGLNTPSSYVNNLNGALRIPPNSEIAVQSIKLSKTGNIIAQQGGLTFGFYFGRDFDPSVQSDYFDMTSFMTQDTVGEPFDSLNVKELATDTTKTFNRILWHPNLLENTSSVINPGASCTVNRNASNEFIGFQFRTTNCSSGKNVNTNLPTAFIGTTFGSTVEPTVIGNIITNPAPGVDPLSFIGTTYPLSLAGGEFNCSLENSSVSEWSVGLSRCSRTTDYRGDPADLTTPSYFNGNGFEFYDYVARQVTEGASKIIRLFHCIGNGGADVEMVEINYGTPLDGIAETIVAVKWGVNGEQVSCKLTKANGSVLTLCDGTSGTSASNAKPVNMMCRFLYPKVTLAPTKSMKIDTFSGVDLKDFVYGDAEVGSVSSDGWLFKDFWAYLQNSGQESSVGENFENENVNNRENGFAVQTGLNGVGQVDYALAGVNLVFEETYGLDDDTDEAIGYFYSQGINSAKTYGFDNQPVALPAAPVTTIPWVWSSSTVPVLKNTNSLFVRLKNMTFDSANFSTSNMSKILYHIPAFSNNGESTGSLFFEPSERVYLKLNNAYEINMTTIEVDIVNSNETISQDLLGKTVVVFHIKDSKF